MIGMGYYILINLFLYYPYNYEENLDFYYLTSFKNNKYKFVR